MARRKGSVDFKWATEKECAKCGKTFLAAPEHIFKQKSQWFCSWTCYNHRDDAERGEKA